MLKLGLCCTDVGLTIFDLLLRSNYSTGEEGLYIFRTTYYFLFVITGYGLCVRSTKLHSTLRMDVTS